MKNTLTYRGYTARVEFDRRDKIFVGHVLGIQDNISFHGETVAKLMADFRAALDHYLADCKATGRKALKPYSGKLMLRIPQEVHAHAALAAEAHGKSLNQWAAEVLAKAG